MLSSSSHPTSPLNFQKFLSCKVRVSGDSTSVLPPPNSGLLSGRLVGDYTPSKAVGVQSDEVATISASCVKPCGDSKMIFGALTLANARLASKTPRTNPFYLVLRKLTKTKTFLRPGRIISSRLYKELSYYKTQRLIK